jgi:hypothetical protein
VEGSFTPDGALLVDMLPSRVSLVVLTERKNRARSVKRVSEGKYKGEERN